MLHQYSGGGQASSMAAAAAAASTFSMFFPMPTAGGGGGGGVEEASYCSFDDHSGSKVTASTSPSSSSPSPASSFSSAGTVVDCTLSLGTPSSRRAEPVSRWTATELQPHRYPSVSAPAISCWDATATASATESYYYHHQQQQQGKHHTAAGAAPACRGAAGHDQFLDRRCANCGTSSTPLWRNGPRGPKSLCNACGIRFKKEERRAAEGGAGCGYTATHHHHHQEQQQQRAPRVAMAVSYGGDADAWRLNVAVPPAPAFSAWPPERASCLFQHN